MYFCRNFYYYYFYYCCYRNKEGLTPFTLSAKLGNKEMFEYLLEEKKQVQIQSIFILILLIIDYYCNNYCYFNRYNGHTDQLPVC